MTSPTRTPTCPLLIALALSLTATLGVAAAQHRVTITIPYALLLHVDAHQSTTTTLDESVHVTAEIKTPLNLYLHTNDAWRLTITTQNGQQRTPTGPHSAHTLTERQLGLRVEDGERVNFTVNRLPSGN